jgi:hypothetical protein
MANKRMLETRAQLSAQKQESTKLAKALQKEVRRRPLAPHLYRVSTGASVAVCCVLDSTMIDLSCICQRVAVAVAVVVVVAVVVAGR